MYIENINSPKDIKELSVEQLSVLAEEVRTALIRKLSEHGGHIGPNLGMVETTIALHYVFNSPIDKIVFDVSHQSYVHKMLTGRMAAFLDPAKYDDVTGYTNPDESEHDFFTIGTNMVVFSRYIRRVVLELVSPCITNIYIDRISIAMKFPKSWYR